MVKIIELKNHYAAAMKEYKYSEAGCLLNIWYFRNTSPSSISNLAHYWEGNKILDGVDLIQ